METTVDPNGRNDPLLLAGRILTLLMQGFIAFGAVFVTFAIPIIIIFRDRINAEILADHGDKVTAFPAFQIAALLCVVLGVMALAFIFFKKLRHIVESVGDGDPFNPENADRLSSMGWLMLGIHVLGMAAAGLAYGIADWARQIDDADFNIDIGLDFTSILMIVILFILARVFRHGAEMRDDLEGTV